MGENADKVLKALANPSHKWRTIDGVAKDTGLSSEVVRQEIEANRDQIIRSSIPNIRGKPLYTTREHYQRMSSKRSQELVTEIATEISETDPEDIQKISSLVIELLNEYHRQALSQSEKSFYWAVVAAVIGFIFFISSLATLFMLQLQAISTIGMISGAVIEVVAGLQFYLYGKTTAQLAYYHQSLDRIQRIVIANSICEALDGENKQKSRAELVKLVAAPAQMMPLVPTLQNDGKSS